MLASVNPSHGPLIVGTILNMRYARSVSSVITDCAGSGTLRWKGRVSEACSITNIEVGQEICKLFETLGIVGHFSNGLFRQTVCQEDQICIFDGALWDEAASLKS
jgi:hypothetical protein